MPDSTPARQDGTSAQPDDPAFLARVAAYLDQTLSDADLQTFSRELETDDAKRQTFALICLGDALAYEEFAHAEPALDLDGVATGSDAGVDASLHDAQVMQAIVDAPEPPQPSIVAPVSPPPAWMRKRQSRVAGRITRILAVAATIAIVALGGYLLLRPQTTAATLADAISATWDGKPPKQGGRIAEGQQFSLTSGLALVRCDGGTEVVVEGPAQFTVASADRIDLQSGRAWVRLMSGASGFEVRTPSGIITDLGTEFGVSIGADNSADVHVFEGKVRVAPAAAASKSLEVAAGDAAQLQNRAVSFSAGGAVPQRFVRDLARPVKSLELVDLLSGGDGSGGLRGGMIDPTNGQASRTGKMEPGGDLTSDRVYHRVPQLTVLDGTFMPERTVPTQVNSAGHTFMFPAASGTGTVRICTGGAPPVFKNGSSIYTELAGVDYAQPDHSYIFLHPDTGVTFDLDAIRRLHPRASLTGFRTLIGSPMKAVSRNKADVYVLVDGVARFSRAGFVAADGVFQVDLPLTSGDRFLTLVTTSGGDGVKADQVLIADPVLDVAAVP